jgi:hypothetical protein
MAAVDRIGLRLPTAGRHRLEAQAQEWDVSLSEAVRRLLIRALHARAYEQSHPGMLNNRDGRISG